MDAKIKSYYHTNRQLWDKLAEVHSKTSFYNVSSLEFSGTSLNETEQTELGAIDGLDVLHLQCHFGLDSISLKRKGANRVLGVDFSHTAIEKARSLAKKFNVDVAFQHDNVLNFDSTFKFDLVYTSYGALCWLHDLNKWAEVVSKSLKKGGLLYLIEFHPALMMFEFESGQMKPEYSYFFQKEPIKEHMTHSYADSSTPIMLDNYCWNHPISDVFNALKKVGFDILFIHEFPFCHYGCFPNMKQNVKGDWYMSGFENLLPLMYSIKAKKK